MLENKEYKEVLKREGLKNTKHRTSILEVMEHSEVPLTAEEIFIRLKEWNVAISLSTVYRVLETLVTKDLVNKSSISNDSKALFEINRMEHKHHLVCMGCKKMVSVEGCPFEEFEKKIQGTNGFDITGHKLEIYGYCAECKHGK
ncbi:MAG: transcriptional repressor [Clostridia bacterium]|nr:transcriptional repressor [Clostridia bacterium]